MKTRAYGVFVASMLAVGLSAQDASFEVASVKRNASHESNGLLRVLPGGRLTATNFSVRQLINFAWQLAGFQVVGGPAWLNDDGYDIVAKMEGDPAQVAPGTGQPDPRQLAVRNLLEDRFKLKTHREMREMDIYALVLARPGSHGPKLKPSSLDCAKETPSACGIFGSSGRLRSGGLNANMIAQALQPMSGRMVVNRTGLAGSWDFELTYAPRTRAGPDAPTADPDAPDFFTAVQEQLGLKLESARGPVEVLVIDSVERPSED